ncbi:MAG: aminofutalosine synthase MqnE [Gemmatimonadetes bacterium]|nr:aminofutalosine synthase MqnE [Gemmatimonadota bacterium]MBT8478932.1 aminofutalosine synthase MqnE [Gemmatimonadota bacterium]NNK49263.1 aminofutalosine synthase MqnE [Gemmatimonadota bacterium]
MSVRPEDRELIPIAEKVEAGERISREEAIALFETDDLLAVGSMADLVNRRLNGDRVYYVANQHINPTNVCILNKVCVFCSYGVRPVAEDAYTMSLEEVYAEADAARHSPTREFHIVGGLHPKLPLSYYTDMVRGLKERHPRVQVKALTAVEIAHLARIEGIATRDVIRELQEAGLDAMPGGGAEVFSPAVRSTIADRKLVADEWLQVHREAHELGIPTNCTLLYGHVESPADRVDHMLMLRDLQDETGGFSTFIPLAWHPDNTALGREMGAEGRRTGGIDDLKALAVGRIFLDNVPHIKTHWIMVTTKVSQIALSFGVDDLEGTVVLEKITHTAGADTPIGLDLDEIVRLIRDAGKIPVERDSLYNVVREPALS